jgi:hypothetical protein
MQKITCSLVALACAACASSAPSGANPGDNETDTGAKTGADAGINGGDSGVSNGGDASRTSSEDSGGGSSDGATGGDASLGTESGMAVSDSGKDVGQGKTKRTSIAWAWIYLPDTLAAIEPNASSFTHVSPLIYQINYAYTGGVAQFWNTSSDSFGGGLTSTSVTQQIHAMGLKSLPVILAGASNGGTDQGIQTVLTDASVQQSFISSMLSEAKSKSYDGYNLDWEMAQWETTYSAYGTQLISFLGAFQSALHEAGMILTFDVVDFNVVQSNCSGGSGPVDLTKLGGVVDLAIVEDYNSNFGTASATCPSSLPDPLLCNQTFMDDLNFMCAYLPANVISIGMNACSTTSSSCGMGTNTIAASAISAIESYGIQSVAIFPQANSDGPSGGYDIYDSVGMTPPGETWFTALQGFLNY